MVEMNPKLKSKGEIVPYRFYRDPASGRAFSLFSSWVPDGAVVVGEGYTIAWPDGTQGCGRGAFATVGDAEAYLANVPKGFKGMSQY
jgi:hypothetical protein